MSAKIILGLLQKISRQKEKVHNIGMNYCRENLEFYHKIEDYVFIRNGNEAAFSDLKEFDRLRKQINNIELSDTIVDDMFELDDDINKIKNYLNKGYLVPKNQVAVSNNSSAIINEAQELINKSKNYIFVASNEKMPLSERFEFFRINSILEKVKTNEPTDEDIRKISSEILKLKAFINDGRAITFDKLENEISLTDSIIEMINQFDKRLFKENEFPKTALIKNILQNEQDCFKRANAFYKFVGTDIPRLIKVVKEWGEKAVLKPQTRLYDEKEKLLKLRDKEIFEVETAYIRGKTNVKSIFGGRPQGEQMSNAQRRQRIKKIKDNYSLKWRNFEKNINNIIEEEKAVIEKNKKLAEDIEKYLRKNISGLKFR